jgi:lysocardiolipin and lysophospholipid acyltransferase
MKRAYINSIAGLFFSFTAMILTDFCGTEVFVYSDETDILTDSKIGLVISNHNCRVDWMYVGWLYAVICDMGFYLKVIMKDSLRSVPVFGWAAQILLNIFLSRNKDKDIPYIRKMITYLLHADKKLFLLLFPEGTDLSPSNLNKSLNFAREKGIREYRKVLYPKPAGFVACLRLLKGFHLSMHDLTVAYKDYKDGERPSDRDFLFG